MKITRRDLIVALVSVGASVGVYVAADTSTRPTVMGSAGFEWNDIPVVTNADRTVRNFFKAPTATLDQLECHVTSLNPGLMSHPAHHHVNEELVIVKEGTVECLVAGELKRFGPGSVIFNASNVEHSLKNVGTNQAVYHVISWYSPGMLYKATNSVAN